MLSMHALSLHLLVIAVSFTCTAAQFPVSDGVNDLFAILTQCPIPSSYPPTNEYFCYRTEMQMSFGLTFCDPVFVRQRQISASDTTETYSIYYINTPGRLRGSNYLNRWNIQCPTGQLMYYDLPEHTIEESASSPFFVDPVCLDFLKLSRDFGDQVSCGINTPEGDLEPSRLLVEFRSNKSQRRPGFRMRIVCFDPKEQNSSGCTTTSIKRRRDVPLSSDDIKGRDHEAVLEEVAAKVEREKRDPHYSYYKKDRFEQEQIPRDATVVYRKNSVTVFVEIHYEVKVLFYYDRITSFHSFNEFDGVSSLFDTGNETFSFRGFGVITIVEEIAYYALYGVNPMLLPNTEEQSMIRQLLDASEALVTDEDELIEEEPVPTEPPTRRWKRSNAQQRTSRQATGGNFPSNIIALAQSMQNSCNAILRSVALSIVNA